MNETAPPSLARCPKLGINALDKEVAELYLPFRLEDDQQKARDVAAPPKPFAAFGSFRQRHGDTIERNCLRTIEAPAKLESVGCAHRGGLSQAFAHQEGEGNGRLQRSMATTECDLLVYSQTTKPPHKGKSFSTDLDREEAWERKKEQYLLEEDDDCDEEDEYGADEGAYDETCEKDGAVESSSENDDGGMLKGDAKGSVKHDLDQGEGNLDAGGVLLDVAHVDEDNLSEDGIKKAKRRMPFSRKKSLTRRHAKPVMRERTKSLTDEDLEELRGSIDLGFGFSYSERCNLKSTLPALELYYAINKNYVDAQSRSSPVSPLDGNALVRTNSAGSNALSPSRETWRISSPGDHPSQVKTRLRHWAQAVACSVKQEGYLE